MKSCLPLYYEYSKLDVSHFAERATEISKRSDKMAAVPPLAVTSIKTPLQQT